jgi:small conductance mechanosensitive channel
MHGLVRTLLALLLLAAPALATPTTALLPAPPPAAAQLSGAQEGALAELRSADEARDAAEAAMMAAPGDAAAKTAYEEAGAAFDAALKKARGLREAAGGRSSEYGQAIFEVSGLAEDGSAEAALGLVQRWTDQGREWVVQDGPGVVVKLLVFLVILAVFRVLSRVAGGVVRKALETGRMNASDLLKRFFIGLAQKAVFFTGLIIALEQIGVPVAPLLAGVGVVGFIVGFALQDTLSNFAAGVMILLYRPYDVGNFITAAGESGSVKDMNLVSTTITTPDNQVLILPNSSIWGGVIRNVTRQETRRVDMVVGVSYDADLDRTLEALTEVVTAHEKVLADPAPVIRVVALGESSVDIVVRPWSKTSDYWDVHFDLHKQIKERLDREGIGIPYPQRDLHLVSVPEGVTIGGGA